MKIWKREQVPMSVRPRKHRGHFRFSVVSGLVVLIAIVVAVVVPALSGHPLRTREAGAIAAAIVVGAGLLALLPYWPVTVVSAALVTVASVPALENGTGAVPALLAGVLGVLFAPAFQIANHWEKVVLLRFGRFRRVFGPGLHLVMPLADTTVRFTDMRVRVTDFTAEKSITRDTVPVHVDALAFWLVWDAEKAMLEVENYIDAVSLSAQTALRDAIGRNDLATLLSERERLGSEIQATLDEKTNPWGVTILSIELKEVLIPKELEDALSKRAQAERERQARVILASAEVEIAKRFEEAAETYRNDPTALKIRSMNMAFDSIRANRNIVLMPSSALETLDLGTALGTAAFSQGRQEDEEEEE